jgi:hypothetical protein
MGIQTPNPRGQPEPTAPGKPGSRQPPGNNTGTDQDRDEGQDIPKTGRDPSEPLEQDISDEISSDDDVDEDQDDADEDEVGSIELPGEGRETDGLDGSRSAGNP